MDIREKISMAGYFMRHMGRRFSADECQQNAAALTYMSLFAVVPLMTLMYSMFSLVPAFQGLGDQVQELIFSNFVPESGAEIEQYLTEFSSQARKLSAVGAIILVVTSYLMLSSIEKTFNNIWSTAGSRRGLSSFLLYWGVLSLGPLLLGLGIMMRTYLLSFQLIVDEVDKLGVIASLFEFLPFIMSWAAFTLLYIAVPNCRVSVRYAAMGGFITMVLFEFAKYAFGVAIVNSSYTTVYGAFAIVPIFLIWLYLVWIVVLGGAELVRGLETFQSAWRGYDYPEMIAVLVVLWECWQWQQKGHEVSDKQMVATGLEQQHWLRLRDMLLEKKILVATNTGRYVLTRDPGHLSLRELASFTGRDAFELPGVKAAEVLQKYPWYSKALAIFRETNEELSQSLSPTVEQLFTGVSEHVEQKSSANREVDGS